MLGMVRLGMALLCSTDEFEIKMIEPTPPALRTQTDTDLNCFYQEMHCGRWIAKD